MNGAPLILVAGATGYVGTRLIPVLLRSGFRVRALARNPAVLQPRPWFDQVEVLPGDVLDPSSLPAAFEGVDTAYYLIHNMSGGRGYRHLETDAAANFGAAARLARVRQIIYLGGLGEGSHHGHMESRHKTGEALRASGPPVIEFRACVIIGTGSISFEIIRSMANWLPLIPAPLQTERLAQPVSTPDLLQYLLSALDNTTAQGRVVEIGGPDVHLYPDMILECASQMGLRRWKLPIPLYPLELSARIVDRLSPVPLAIARPLMQELVGPSIITDPSARQLFPGIQPMTYPEAVAHALTRDEMPAEAPWMDSLITRSPLNQSHVRTRGEGFLIDYHEAQVEAAPRGVAALLLDGPAQEPAGWTVHAAQPGSWLRLEQRRGGRDRLYLEIQLKGELLRWALLFEPKGLTAHLQRVLRLPGGASLPAARGALTAGA